MLPPSRKELPENEYFCLKPENMNIIVTGASKGIGRELVKFFSRQEGHNILGLSRDKARMTVLEKECRGTPSRVHVFPFDLTGKDLSQLLEVIDQELGSVDILINNAGKMVNKPATELTGNDFDDIFSTNVKAPFRLIVSLFPKFTKKSHIVNIGSMGGYQGSVKFSGLSLYSASKGALATLTECLAEEFKDHGVKVNCLALGSAQTEMLEMAFPGYRAPVSAEEMAGYIARFALEGHKYFNGKVLPVSSSTP